MFWYKTMVVLSYCQYHSIMTATSHDLLTPGYSSLAQHNLQSPLDFDPIKISEDAFTP